jgi:hypothetical protein
MTRLPAGPRPIQSVPPMLGRPLRAVLFACLVLALWTLARPAAAAMAPFCDDRGASALAPPPALEASDLAMVRARTPACGADPMPFSATARPPQRRAAPPSVSADATLLVRLLIPPPAPRALLEVPVVHARPPRGERSRVERPPRG